MGVGDGIVLRGYSHDPNAGMRAMIEMNTPMMVPIDARIANVLVQLPS
jgi:hypothetical protein